MVKEVCFWHLGSLGNKPFNNHDKFCLKGNGVSFICLEVRASFCAATSQPLQNEEKIIPKHLLANTIQPSRVFTAPAISGTRITRQRSLMRGKSKWLSGHFNDHRVRKVIMKNTWKSWNIIARKFPNWIEIFVQFQYWGGN